MDTRGPVQSLAIFRGFCAYTQCREWQYSAADHYNMNGVGVGCGVAWHGVRDICGQH